MRSSFLLLILSLACLSGRGQNQYHVSQYMLHQPFVNPASVGSYNTMNGALFYKHQWAGIDGAPRFGGIDINNPLGDNAMIGLGVVYDKVGVNENTDISARYAYRLQLNDNLHLALGVAASMRVMQSDYSTLPEVATDPSFNANTSTIIQPNFKFGGYLFSDKFYVGFAIPNLLKNDINRQGAGFEGTSEFDPSDMHQYLHFGAKFAINDKLELNPSMMLKNVSGSPLQLDVNAHIVYDDKIGFGISYRTSQELIGLLNYRITEVWKLGYAYDFGMSNLGQYTSGSHELMLVFTMKQQKARALIQAPRY